MYGGVRAAHRRTRPDRTGGTAGSGAPCRGARPVAEPAVRQSRRRRSYADRLAGAGARYAPEPGGAGRGDPRRPVLARTPGPRARRAAGARACDRLPAPSRGRQGFAGDRGAGGGTVEGARTPARGTRPRADAQDDARRRNGRARRRIGARRTGARTMTDFRIRSLDHVVLRVRDLERMIGFRSEEHTSELQSLMRKSYAVFCLKIKITEC